MGLIDADALKANFVVLGEFVKDLWHTGTIRGAIDNAPTVDAVEVVRGRWIGVDSSYWRWTHDGGHMVEHITYRCSECARKSITKTNYCPNCGAKMGGDSDGTD